MQPTRAIFLIAALLGSLLFLPGCATSAAGRKVVSAQNAETVAPVLAASASAAVIYAYQRNPDAMAYARAIRSVIQELLLKDDLAPARLQAAILSLPIPELRTPEALLVMTPIFTSYQAFVDQRVKAGLRDNEGLRVLLQALIDGINAGEDAIRISQGWKP